jgi:hypothetical protein
MSEDDKKEQEAYEKRLRRRLEILKEQMQAGKVKFAPGLGVKESLMAVRYGPDGEIDLNTVDGRVRSLALAVTEMHDREELKSAIPFNEIQKTYFEFIEKNFGFFYKIMKEKDMTPHEAGLVASKKPETIAEITEPINDFMETIDTFWNSCSDAAYAHVQDMHGAFRGVFGGDLFPSHNENIASKCGIYTDLIILPDPFLRSKDLFPRWEPDDKAYYFMKHAMNLLQYKDLACSDTLIPIVAVVPDQAALEDEEKQFIFKLGQEDSIIHAKRVFGRDFESFEHLMSFASELDSVEKVVAEIKDNSRVLFDTSWMGSVKEQISRAMTDDNAKLLRTQNPGIIVASQALGRMGISNEILIRSRRLSGTPIIDAPTSWKYFTWKLEYDAEKAGKEQNLKDLHILRGLQNLAENEMIWLGHIPIDALIDIRKSGALDEIRHILGNGVEKLAEANPHNFFRTTDQIFDNIYEAFEKHKENIKQLQSKKWKFAGKGIGTWLAVGTLEVTAAATGIPVWGLSTIVANQLLDVPKLKDIPNSIKQLAQESQKIKKSPVGMLFKYSKKMA